MLTDKQRDKMSFVMYVIYVRIVLDDERTIFVPNIDIHGHTTAYPSRALAATDLYNLRTYRGKRSVIIRKVGPIS